METAPAIDGDFFRSSTSVTETATSRTRIGERTSAPESSPLAFIYRLLSGDRCDARLAANNSLVFCHSQFRSHLSQATGIRTGLPNMAWLWPMIQREMSPHCAMSALASFTWMTRKVLPMDDFISK